MTKRLVIGSMIGLGIAVFGGIVAIVLASVVAFIQNSKISLLGVFTVWAEEAGGGRGLAFDPNFTGMLIVGAVVVVLCALLAAYLVPKRKAVSGA